jgi:1,4-dihydroxy-2-naphthoate octaprenyltransferase
MTTRAPSLSPTVAPGSLRAWWLAVRPRTLGAAVVPVLVGSAVASAAGGFSPWPALAALGGALGLQIAANLANDAADFERGADGPDRLGPPRAAQHGLLGVGELKAATLAALAFALASGVCLALHAGPVVVAFGAASMVAAVAYTAGPWPLAYHGLGEAFVLVFFGIVAVAGTAFVQALRVPSIAWPAAVAVGSLAMALLAVNNLRDIASDARAHKRTLAVRFGERFAVAEFAACIAAPYLISIGLGLAVGPSALLPLVTLPLALPMVKSARRERGPALNRVLAGTARLLFLFGATFALGIALLEAP